MFDEKLKPEEKKEELKKQHIGNYQQGFHQQHAEKDLSAEAEYAARKRKMIIYIIFFLLAFFLFLVFSVWMVKKITYKADSGYNYETQEEKSQASTTSLLPPGQIVDQDTDKALDLDKELKAEDITFGNYYTNLADDFELNFQDYDLPIDSKIQVDNYYEFSRKINLDSHLDQLNQYGYAVISTNSDKNSNFYSASRDLVKQDIPLLISDDFIIYYYQNKLKEFFKEIEKSVFYENVWTIYKEMYEKALTRYERKIADFGISSDPVFEGSRLQLSYLAVLLSLLEPDDNQIDTKPNLKDEQKFSPSEADKFGFILPAFLKDDVLKEVELIKSANQTTKSPVMLYGRDYKVFAVPNSYKNDARLNNFYLVTQWLSSAFPLYFRSSECEDCLLDENDWRINMVAAGYMSSDLSDNQELKNLWAIIYKFISFFSGLRSELTYLHYNQAYEKIFSNEYSIDEIYSPDNPERNANYLAVRDEILKNVFLDLEGAYLRRDENKKNAGMRLLQENYWPNDYIFNKLSGPDLRYLDNKISGKTNVTGCADRSVGGAVRCGGIGLDIANLVYPVKDNEYFIENIRYANYNTKAGELKKEFDKFDLFSWNNNSYWAGLDVGKKALYYPSDHYPVFMRDEKWRQDIGINTFMGTWANLHLELDRLATFNEKTGSFGFPHDCNTYNYVLPNAKLINEVIAKTKMLSQMSAKLGISGKDRVAFGELTDLERTLGNFKKIIRKELEGEMISSTECSLLMDFATLQAPKETGNKSFEIKNNYEQFKGPIQNLSGYKILALVYKAPDGKMLLAAGPVFNYREGK